MASSQRITCFGLAFALAGIILQPAAAQAQEYDWLDEDLPEWVEDLGYEDADSGAISGTGQRAARNGQQRTRAEQCPRCKCDCCLCRDTLTGDWCGRRTCLAENGIVYRGRLTQYFFGVAGGVNEPVPAPFAALGIAGGDTFEYTGTSQHNFLLDLEKFGGLPHGKAIITLENIWGRFGNVSLETGAIGPVFGGFMPADFEAQGVPRLTNFFFLQPLSEQFILGAGKLRLPGTADKNIFANGDGTDQFMNQTFCAPPTFIALFPISAFVVSAIMPQEWGNIVFNVIDPQERSLEYFEFDSLFDQGVTLQSQIEVKTNFFCKPGEHHVGGVWKHVDLLNLRTTPLPPYYPYPPAPPGTPAFAKKSDSWALYYGFDQYLRVFGKPDAQGNTPGWGLFGRAGIADGGSGNPNFVGWNAQLGFGGDSPFRCGSGDKFGIGYSYAATSTEWGAIPNALFAPRDYQAFEAFYKFQVTPWISVSPDIQWLRGMLGGLTDGDDALVFGTRMNITL